MIEDIRWVEIVQSFFEGVTSLGGGSESGYGNKSRRKERKTEKKMDSRQSEY